jgi:hypothetical protein
MARVLPRLLLSVTVVAAACGRADDGAAAGGRSDTGQQAAAPAAERDSAQVRQAVLHLQEELFKGLVRADSGSSARILAEDWIGFSGDGNRETKARALASSAADSTAVTLDSIHVDSTVVRIHGDAVVAQASGTIWARERGQTATVGLRSTNVFGWRDGRWQILATHLSKVPVPQGRSRTP